VKNIALDGQPVIGPKCIKCFICVEICPDGALAIERK
jgi:formate hydrogenlyase subunit 6/NADH:ubiquinone oxidoreductase subunit I